MQDAQSIKIAAAQQVAAADERAKMERERRMGVEAMVEAGAPLRFPLEDHERNDAVQQQQNVTILPVSNVVVPLPENDNPVNAPKRSANEILRGVVWRWCLEGEFGIENESGALVGEVSLRGGSWSQSAEFSHSAYRGSGNPIRRHDDVGFRLCLAAAK